jgi:hypothetical protein
MASALLDPIAAGTAVPASSIAALGDDNFDTELRHLLRIERAVAATKLRFLYSARRRGSHVRHGCRDTAAWVAQMSGQRRGTERRDVALAEEVAAAPVVADALAAGQVSKAQAAELVAAANLPEDVQERLVEHAAVVPVERLGDAVRQAQLDHGAVPADPVPHLDLTKTSAGGRIEGQLDGEGFELVGRAVQAMVDQMGLPTDLPLAQRRAAALVGLARHFLEHTATPCTDRTGVAHALVVIPFETMVARTGGSATLASGAVISGDTARRLACDAGISRIITKGPSEILDVGRSTRTISPALAKAVIARDRHCTRPGCHAPPWLCEIHHIVHWALGGTTSLENLELLCWWHHQLEHEPTADRRRGAACAPARAHRRAPWASAAPAQTL